MVRPHYAFHRNQTFSFKVGIRPIWLGLVIFLLVVSWACAEKITLKERLSSRVVRRLDLDGVWSRLVHENGQASLEMILSVPGLDPALVQTADFSMDLGSLYFYGSKEIEPGQSSVYFRTTSFGCSEEDQYVQRATVSWSRNLLHITFVSSIPDAPAGCGWYGASPIGGYQEVSGMAGTLERIYLLNLYFNEFYVRREVRMRFVNTGKTIDLYGNGSEFAFADNITSTGVGIEPTPFVGQIVDANGHPLNGVKISAQTLHCFTDHQLGSDGKLRFDGVLDGSFRLDGLVAPYGETLFTIHAEDLAGNDYKRELLIAPSEMTATNGAYQLGMIQLSEPDWRYGEGYRTVSWDDQGAYIHLHRDLANPKMSHVLQSRPVAAVGASARYREEVQITALKLASLGFREDKEGTPLVSTRTRWEGPAIRATKLFQTIWFHEASSRVFRAALLNLSSAPSGKVDADTVVALNRLSEGVIWSQNDALAKTMFPNVFDYDAQNGNRWMHATIPKALQSITETLSANGISGPQLLISDSAAFGERLDGNGNNIGKSHKAGSEVDVHWLTAEGTPGSGFFYESLKGQTITFNDGVNLVPVVFNKPLKLDQNDVPPVDGELTDYALPADPAVQEQFINQLKNKKTWRIRSNSDSSPIYSRAKTRVLIEAMQAAGANQVIFNDPVLLTEIGGVLIPLKGHGNHVHFGRIYDLEELLPAGASGAPLFVPSSP